MNQIRLGKTEICVDKNGFGALPIQRISKEEAVKLIRKAYDHGIRFFDTAYTYTDSEEKLGEALEGIRDQVYIATKTPAGNNEEFWKNLEESLRRLRTDYVDLFQFHNPSFCPKPGDGTGLYEAMLEAKRQGKVRHIGITNHRLSVAREAVDSGDPAPKLEELDMHELYYGLELPLCPVLAEMERAGMLVDRRALADFGILLDGRIQADEALIYELAGEEFNINSTQQFGRILFDKLGLPPVKKTKTGYSTNADVLEKLRDKHPIVEAVLDYRQLAKLKSTYVDGLTKVIAADGRIHTSFQNTVTATGRLSSTEPNLQNIPVRTELGAELRKMFVAPAGRVLVDADYSQIELRLLAHIAGDEHMIAAFRTGEDIHTVTASQVFGVPPEQVTHEMRRRAKAVNFGIVYGISDFSLSQDIGVTRAEAKAYMEKYFEKYSGVHAYMTQVVERAKADGYVSTLMGRRRWLPELKSSNFNLRSFGERVALNMPIQGTAADLIKKAMLRVDGRLRREGLEARLVLQVHDELIVECPEGEAEQVQRLLAEEMEHVAELAVPLTAEAHAGKSWAEAKG